MLLSEDGAGCAVERREWVLGSGDLRALTGNLLEDYVSLVAPGRGWLSAFLHLLAHPRSRCRWRGRVKCHPDAPLPIAGLASLRHRQGRGFLCRGR